MRGPTSGYPTLLNQRAPYRPIARRPIAWWLIEGIGQSLRRHYKVPTELPPKLLTLVRKLDAIEGNQLVRTLKTTSDHVQTSGKTSDNRSLS